MKIFNKINMRSEDLHAMLKDCYFQDATGVDAEVEDGALVSILGPRDHDLYVATKDMNARNAVAFDSNEPIYGFVDFVGVNSVDVYGGGSNVVYRVGEKIVGTHPLAGENTRVRIVELGDEFYLGNENFASAPTIGEYAVPTSGSTQMTPAASVATSGLCLAIEDERPLTAGTVTSATDKMFRCRVVKL